MQEDYFQFDVFLILQ